MLYYYRISATTLNEVTPHLDHETPAYLAIHANSQEEAAAVISRTPLSHRVEYIFGRPQNKTHLPILSLQELGMEPPGRKHRNSVLYRDMENPAVVYRDLLGAKGRYAIVPEEPEGFTLQHTRKGDPLSSTLINGGRCGNSYDAYSAPAPDGLSHFRGDVYATSILNSRQDLPPLHALTDKIGSPAFLKDGCHPYCQERGRPS